MKLHAKDIVRFERRRIFRFVGTGGGGGLMLGHVVAMREIDEGPRRQVREQPRTAPYLQLVPSHLRHAGIDGEALDHTRVNAESALLGSFLARGEESLHTETNTQKRHAGVDPLHE